MGLCQPSNKCLPFEANVAIVTLFNDIQFKIKILTAAVRISVEFNHSDEASEKQHNCTIFLFFLKTFIIEYYKNRKEFAYCN